MLLYSRLVGFLIRCAIRSQELLKNSQRCFRCFSGSHKPSRDFLDITETLFGFKSAIATEYFARTTWVNDSRNTTFVERRCNCCVHIHMLYPFSNPHTVYAHLGCFSLISISFMNRIFPRSLTDSFRNFICIFLTDSSSTRFAMVCFNENRRTICEILSKILNRF